MATQLDAYQLGRIERAKATLAKAETAGYDTHSLAYTVGSLSWQLGDLIELLEQLVGA